MNLRLKSLMLVLLLSSAFSTSLTLACQGPAPYDFAHTPEMDIWVRATVMKVDDRNFSAILKVHEYYKGKGPEWLAVVRYPVGLETARRVRGYPTTQCLYAGSGTPLIWNKHGYYGLKSNGEGTFTDALENAAHYFFVDGEMDGDYYVDDPDGYMDEIVLSEEEFVAHLLEIGERDEAVEPDRSEASRRPLMRYLLLTLQDGARLQVNPDRSVTMLSDDDPIAISPDGAHTIYREGGDTLVFNYIWGKQYMLEDFRDKIAVPGKHAVFAPDSNLAAVWDEHHLAVYIYRNRGAPHNTDWSSGWYPGMAFEQVAAIHLQTNESENLLLRWSANSSTIVWQDWRGIRHWNLFEEAAPTSVPGVHNVKANRLVDVSRSGRYVSYRNGGEIRVYDSLIDELYDNAWVAPNESYVSVSLPETDDQSFSACRAPMDDNCANERFNPDRSQTSEFPYLMELVGGVYCGEEYGCHVYGLSWHPSTTLTSPGYSGGRNIVVIWEDAGQVAYDPFYEQPAVLRGDYQVEFDFYHSGYFDGSFDGVNLEHFDYVNLEGIVDSPIASIEWGQPIFYDAFMLTATEYLPRTVTIASGPPALEDSASSG